DAATDFDELYCYELIHGVLIVSPPPGESERDPNGELEYLLRAYQSGHEAGSALDKTLSEQYVHLSDSRRRADRVIWAGLGRIPDPGTDVPAIVTGCGITRRSAGSIWPSGFRNTGSSIGSSES